MRILRRKKKNVNVQAVLNEDPGDNAGKVDTCLEMRPSAQGRAKGKSHKTG